MNILADNYFRTLLREEESCTAAYTLQMAGQK